MRVPRALLCGAFVLAACTAAPARPVPLHGVPLTDTTGRPIAAEALRGRVVLLQIVFTGCGTTCPTQVRELADLHDSLTPAVRAGVRFLSVTLDPHDRPADLAAFARRLGAERHGWIFAGGPAPALDQVASRLRALGPRGLADHRTDLFVFDARGQLVQRFAGVPVDRVRLRHELTRLVVDPPPIARAPAP